MTMDMIFEKLRNYRADMKEDLSQLVAINSERDLMTKRENAPFGIGIRKCFDKMIEFARREELSVEDFNGYAMHIDYGEGQETLAILGHLDIVGIQDRYKWDSNPFQLIEKEGFWYGRGVNDNKGPMIGCLYLLKILKELNYKPNKKIRLIIGGAEETTWECMRHYFKYNKMPIYGFSPDGDFPIINCEKGIGYYKYHRKKRATNDGIYNIISITSNEDITRVCSRVEVCIETQKPEELMKLISPEVESKVNENNLVLIYKGISAMGRNPHKGKNAIFKYIKDFKGIEGLDSRAKELIDFLDRYFLDSIYGEKLGLYYKDEETGHTTNNLSYITLNSNGYVISFDFRYPKGTSYGKIKERLIEIGLENELELMIIKEMPLLYVSPDSQLVRGLKLAYQNITGEKPKLFSKGAASYARVLRQGVAFGPTFSSDRPNSHNANECINVDNFMKALLIYANAIKLLT
ncbi:Sapep family Mn(2+)-dependent dipeptidase [Paramaledivibacter caminithermalis]|jgi:predicted dipeptidase|uniref:Dipeptidase, putative n=1 Tax=Paramaledivibacter caminithermalis (strain DSM 15212 / CIP 107654 / DViRD3) TaxID=1121301 RepID=A0A1M6K7L7_PARC5|nr:Sapep family Mn(2+)-dependent dipeptidase [Paramaledivibacter caminithermalis]SHJ54961.1 dipeptidase, putative [Paramaledivibacter caminithermalis DSM 15212]